VTRRRTTGRPANALYPLATCALLALLAACQAGALDAPYDNYLQRLGRTLSVTVPGVVFSAPPRAPRPAELKQDIASSSLDALDFLAISGCSVQITIGKRNSSLGRMARSSQRLLLELEYLLLAPECIDWQRTQGRDALADELQQAWNLKREQLPTLVFNATLGSEEYRSLWRIPVNPGDYPASISSRVISALLAINEQVKRWLDGDYEADNHSFEILLSEVAAGDGGSLLQALAHQSDWLDAANLMVAERMTRGPLCRPGIRPQAADILANVVRKYFIGEVQPRAAALGRRAHELFPAVRGLEELLAGGLPATYANWRAERDERIAYLAAAPRRPVEKLIALQKPSPSQ